MAPHPLSKAEMHAAHIERQSRLWAPGPRLVAPEPSPNVRIIYLRRTSYGPDACEHVKLWYIAVALRGARTARQVIAEEVCAESGVSFADLRSASQTKPICIVRHHLFYRLFAETTLSLPQIGQFVGGRDHTTVRSGIHRHAMRNGLPVPRVSS